MNETGLVIRRHAGLMAAVAVTALGLAVGYLWHFAAAGGGVSLLIGLVLTGVGAFHAFAWADARTPLLVADDTGIRTRLGAAWTGVPWSQIERVEVDERGRVTDGHVAVVSPAADELIESGWRSRLGAAVNRWFYDSPLVVPFGLTTTVSVLDVPATLARLAGGRAAVVVLDGAVDEPEPTVALTGSHRLRPAADERVPVQRDLAEAENFSSAGSAAMPEIDDQDRTSDELAPTSGLPNTDGDDEPAGQRGGEPRKSRLPFIAARQAGPPLPLAKVVAALRSYPARREDVTIPFRHEPATEGSLALSHPYLDEPTEPLPEIEQLRRRHEVETPELPISNVELIIDATTDMSARAMSKVRRRAPLTASTEMTHGGESVAPADLPAADDLLIGGELRGAREALGLDVDELAERTRIRPYVIESIEVDDFRPCGGDFYARGHLRMLARILGLEVEPLMETYDEHFATSPINPRAVFDAELSTAATGLVRGGSARSGWGGWAGLAAAVLVLVLIWGVAKYLADGSGAPVTAAPPTQNSAGLGSPGPGNKLLPKPEPATARVRLAAVGGGSRVVVKDRKGGVVFAGVLTDGSSRMAEGLAPLHVMAVDGGVIRIGTQGKSLGYIGDAGVRSRHLIAAPAAD